MHVCLANIKSVVLSWMLVQNKKSTQLDIICSSLLLGRVYFVVVKRFAASEQNSILVYSKYVVHGILVDPRV